VAICAVCGQENPDVARFCFACGSRFRPAEATGAEERKIVTVLFCDLVGFTALSDRADPEDVRATLRPYHARLAEEIERFGGTVEKFIGDAVMAVYGAPVAHEDDAERAVRSALRILEAMDQLNASGSGLHLAVRIGINTGEAVVTLAGGSPDREGMVAGDVVNTAARLESVAPTGAIVVGEATYRATKTIFDYEQLQPVKVKGKAESIRIWRPIAPKSRYGIDVAPASTTPFVGREDELELLKRTFTRARRENSVQLVTLMGEPGVGKTRLIRELFGYTDGLRELQYWRQGRCLPYGEGITFWALGEIVKAQAGILESDPPEEARPKLRAAIRSVIDQEQEADWVEARLAPLIGVGGLEAAGGAERVQSFSGWRRFIEALASNRPLVLVFEDIHWADRSMLQFIEYLVEWTTDVPLLVVCSARPELYERYPGWGGGKRNATTISLPPLTDREISQLISALLPASIPRDVYDLILERAGGNPLYAEEFARMLSDQESMERDPNKVLSAADIRFPDSLQAIIAARLDTLTQERKVLLQDASVIGKVFWSGALAFMSGRAEVDVIEGLHELARKELVRPSRTSSVKDQVEHSFWHFLIRDVAYGQIPRLARASKHRMVAEWTERLAGERVADHAEVLAYHFGEALDLSRAAGDDEGSRALEEPTRRFRVLAGDRAAGLDLARSEEHYRKALELFAPGDVGRTRVLARAAEVAARSGRFAEAERDFDEAIAEFKELGNLVGAGDAMARLGNLLWFRGETARSREVTRAAIQLLEEQAPGPELANAYVQEAGDRLERGILDDAIGWAEKAIALSEEVGANEQMAYALGVRGTARTYAGDLGGADDVRQALELSLGLGLTREAARLHSPLGELLRATEGPASGLETGQRGVELAERAGNVDLAMAVRTEILTCLFDLGRWDELLESGEQIVRWARATGSEWIRVLAVSHQARVLLLRGRLSESLALEEGVLSEAREIGDLQVLVPALAFAAVVEHGNGRDAEALSLIREFDELTRDRPAWYRAEYLPDLVSIAVAGGDVAMGEALMQDIEVHAARHVLCVQMGRASVAEGRDQFEAAAELFRETGEGWAALGFLFDHGRCLLGAGRCLQQVGGQGAIEELQRARSLFEQVGALPSLAEVDSRLEHAAAPQP
jgi:class 3 adenylate cyclase/tetratricopeptide (TPR) repeat protein